MKRTGLVLLGLLMATASACSTYFDNSKYYMPSFSPNIEPISICQYYDVLVDRGIDWVVVVNGPQRVKGCGPRKDPYVSIAAGRTLNPSWRAWDGSFGMAGTNYSLRTLFPEDREREYQQRKPSPDSVYFVPDRVEDPTTFVSNGLEWEHTYVREFTRYPENRSSGPNPPPGPARLQWIRDTYVYRHPEGWWLRVRATFRPEMENFPEILASRRDTLRQVVESIRIEPKDPSRVSCATDERGREFCRYRWP
jgi:hypothetical protein